MAGFWTTSIPLSQRAVRPCRTPGPTHCYQRSIPTPLLAPDQTLLQIWWESSSKVTSYHELPKFGWDKRQLASPSLHLFRGNAPGYVVLGWASDRIVRSV